MTHWNLWVPANQTCQRQPGGWVGPLCDHRCFAQRVIASILLCIRKSSKDIKRLDTDTQILLFTFYTRIIINDHNTASEGKESQRKALPKLKTKHPETSVVVSPEEKDGGPWTASSTFSDVTRFHSEWLHQVERKRALHRQVFQVRYCLT